MGAFPIGSVEGILSGAGARLDERGRALDFGDPAREALALERACALADRTSFSRLVGTGPDLLDLLHRLSTQDLRGLAEGAGTTTVLTTAKGRILARLFLHRLPDGAGVLAIAGPGEGPDILEHLRRFTFAEDAGLANRTAETFQFALVGPGAREAATAASIPVPEGLGVVPWRPAGETLYVVGSDGWSERGISVVGPATAAAAAWEPLVAAARQSGGVPCGEVALEAWRIAQGIPAPGRELTPDRNPLEAGLWDAVSFAKGCYVGQEIIARLNTYDKVARILLGLSLTAESASASAGATLFQGGRAVGEITSVAVPPGGGAPIALGFVKRHDADLDAPLRLGPDEDAPRATVIRIHGRKG